MSSAEDTAVSTVDLHTHSTASDGVLAPAQLVTLAVARGLRVLGLTDHDTVAGLAEAATAAEAAGLQLVPGVELSTHVTAGEVHMLGYFFDPNYGVMEIQGHELAEKLYEKVSHTLKETSGSSNTGHVDFMPITLRSQSP